MGPRTEILISLGKTVAQITADFAPVPGLCPAVDLLCGLIELCENITLNRYANTTQTCDFTISERYPIEMLLGTLEIDVMKCLLLSERM